MAIKILESKGIYGNLLHADSPDHLPLLYFHHYVLFVVTFIFCFFALIEYFIRLSKEKQQNGKIDFINIRINKSHIPRINRSLYVRSLLFVAGLSILILILLVVYLDYNVVCADFMCILLVVFALFFGLLGYNMVNYIFIYLLYNVFLFIGQYHRERIIYNLLAQIDSSISINPIAYEIFKKSPTYILNEPAFYGNVLLPWVQSQPDGISLNQFSLLILLLIFFAVCYFVTKDFSQNLWGNFGTDHEISHNDGQFLDK